MENSSAWGYANPTGRKFQFLLRQNRSSRRLEVAASLLGTLGLKHNVRTLDAIHLTTAQALHDRSRLTAFVAADKKLLTVAAACGLTVLDVG